MKGAQLPIDTFVHDEGSLAIDNMAATIFLATAQVMGMLDDHRIGPHLDQEMACVLYARSRDVKLISSVKQHNQVIETVVRALKIPYAIDQIQRVCPGRVLGSD